MAAARYFIGIDLGTTNTAVAYLDRREAKKPRGRYEPLPIYIWDVPQWVARGQIATWGTLPSCLYYADEKPDAETPFPDPWVAGRWAHSLGLENATRFVHSSKSWLCHAGVDRTAAILPWGAPEDVPLLSPVQAASRLLGHIRQAWNRQQRDPDGIDGAKHPFEDQHITITVPASFDQVSRSLTLQAAEDAGLPDVHVLEEPIAALYGWIWPVAHKKSLGLALGKKPKRILVVDVGGGTTDFSLVAAHVDDDQLVLTREAVGEHLLLGGDNMDLALAKRVEETLTKSESPTTPQRLSVMQWHHLVARCRDAKETLLGHADDAAEQVPVAIPGRGRGVVAGTIRAAVERRQVREVILDGFFPFVPWESTPQTPAGSGLREFGLPFAKDPVVTRHLATFLRRHLDEAPHFLCFNGGVFHAALLAERVRDQLAAWFPERSIAPLDTDSLDHAVACGAVYSAWSAAHDGVRIAAGSAHAIYLGIDPASAPPGDGIPAVCVMPRGLDVGKTIHLKKPRLELLANTPVRFPAFTGSTGEDKPGDVVHLDPAEVQALPPVEARLRIGRQREHRTIHVGLRAQLTELGTVQLACESREPDLEAAWQLEFDVRAVMGNADDPPPTTSAPEGNAEQPADANAVETLSTDAAQQPAILAVPDEVDALIKRAFAGAQGTPLPGKMSGRMEEAIGLPRSEWPAELCRALADRLQGLARGRKRTKDHEIRWLNLTGYCLRPGFGFAQDAVRVERAWALFNQGLEFKRERQNQVDWWIYWRRLAGGLDAARQEIVFNTLANTLPGNVPLRPQTGGNARKDADVPAWGVEGLRLACSLEKVPRKRKQLLGQWFLDRILAGKAHEAEWWCLGRLSTREPFHATADVVLRPAVVSEWLTALMSRTVPTQWPESAANGLIQMARRTDDRGRDVPENLRELLVTALRKRGVANATLRPLRDVIALDDGSAAQLLGEVLPHGLALAD